LSRTSATLAHVRNGISQPHDNQNSGDNDVGLDLSTQKMMAMLVWTHSKYDQVDYKLLSVLNLSQASFSVAKTAALIIFCSTVAA
jgi:hypothetical protein